MTFSNFTTASRRLAARRDLRKVACVPAIVLATIVLLACAADGLAQHVHYPHSTQTMAPGAIGQRQLMRGGPVVGYFQPVEIMAPPGVMISLASDGRFGDQQAAPVKAGLLVGQVYRFKVTNIPLHEGTEVFPSLELLDRLHPPEGQTLRFPIPIDLTLEELQWAIAGRFVTRVIYVEDPDNALPLQDDPRQTRVAEVSRRENVLQVADRMGRPVAILRIGSRVPDFDAVSGQFLFGTPPLVRFGAAPPARQVAAQQKLPNTMRHAPVPRVPLDERRPW